MITKDEAMKLALEALESAANNEGNFHDYRYAITAIRQALEQPDMGVDRGAWSDVPDATKWVDELRGDEEPEQEPVAHLWECLGRWSAYLATNGTQADCAPPDYLVEAVKVATAPPSKPWVSLTDEEIAEGAKQSWVDKQAFESAVWWAEEKLKEKNT